MKKSTLFVLLLAAVLLFMTACNPATKEPAATDDPTSIPGVAEDPNVPSKDKFVKANDTDIKNITSALSQINLDDSDTTTSTSSRKYTFTIKEDAKIFDNQSNKRKVSGSFTIDVSSESTSEKTESGENRPYNEVTIFNGTVIIGDGGDNDDVYVMNDFTVNRVSTENGSPKVTYQGSLKFRDKELVDSNNTDTTSINDFFNSIMSQIISEDISEKEINEDLFIITCKFDSKTTNGNLSIKMDQADPKKLCQVIMVNFSKLNDSSLTAKIVEYFTFDEKTPVPTLTDVQIKYASLNGRYFTSDSLTNSEEFMKLLTSMSQGK